MREHSVSFLEELGWNSYFADSFNRLDRPDLTPARVVNQSKFAYRICCEKGDLAASLPGRILHNAKKGDFSPAVGDWVAIKYDKSDNRAIIEAILPRKSSFSRKVPGLRNKEQIIASNIDVAFIVSGLDDSRNLNLRRIERYLTTLSWDSGTSPVIILNKADLCDDVETCLQDVAGVAAEIPVHVISATEGHGVAYLKKYLVTGVTAAFLGASGVGKSSIINALLEEERVKSGEVSEEDHLGMHTTSHRELFLLPDGGAVIDTPGIREIQLWANEDALFHAFPDIEQLASECRFSNCNHVSEPACAIREAIEKDHLDSSRFESYLKLRKEIRSLESRYKHKKRPAES